MNKNSSAHYKFGLSPIIYDDSKILILGSLPSEESISKQEYYAKPANRFWRVLSAIFNISVPTSYSGKIDLLKANHIALWDVINHAVREGSLDSAIKNEEVNDIIYILNKYSSIHTIVFNGAKAYNSFSRHIGEIRVGREIKIFKLYSTSPANAKFNLDKLIENWKPAFINGI
jgi:TDG/mug DNA glycosylase family protein